MSFKDVLNKHYGHAQNSVKKYEVGGKVVTKNGATNDAKKGGYFDGRPHSEGGIKAVNIDVNQPIEVEGGEVVITKRAVADTTKKEFEGKMMTNKEILSKINQSGGGVAFEHGGEIDAEEMADVAGNTALGAEMQFAEGGKIDDDFELSDDDLNFDFDEEEFEDGGIIPENQQRVLEIIVNSGKPEISMSEIYNRYGQKFPSGTYDDFTEAVDDLIRSNLIDSTPQERWVLTQKGFDKIDEIRQANQNQNSQISNQSNQPREIESIRVKIKDIQDPNGYKNNMQNLYRGPYQKIFEKISIFDDTEEYFQSFGKDLKRRDLNEFYVTITKPKLKTDLDSFINAINKLNRVSIVSVIFKDSASTQSVQVNPLFEEFPYFAPDAIKEYNPSVLTVQTRSEDSKLLDSEFKEKSRKKEKNIEIYEQLINDIPVENVVERVELSLLLNQEEEELKLMQNESYIRMPNYYQFTDSVGNQQKMQRRIYSEPLDDLILMAKAEEIALVKFRPTEYSFLSTFTDMLTQCVTHYDNFLTNWIINFFGNWIKYSNDNGNSYSYLSNPDNLPFEISKVGRAITLQSKDYYAPMMVYQGLSQPYDRVGFDIFPISYYATNYSYANWFAETKGERLGTEGVILPCILNIRRPLDLSMFGIRKVNSKNFFDAVYLQTGFTPEDLKVNPAFLLENTPDLEVWVYIRNNPEMLKLLKESKIVDGIHMFENNPSVDVGKPEYETEVWITFYPEQTKVLPIFQMRQIFDGDRGRFDRGWFTKSQFLKWGGKL